MERALTNPCDLKNQLVVSTSCIPDAHGIVPTGGDDSAVTEDTDSSDTTLVIRESLLAVFSNFVSDTHGPVHRAGDNSAVGENGESNDRIFVIDHSHLVAAWHHQHTFKGFQLWTGFKGVGFFSQLFEGNFLFGFSQTTQQLR